MGKALSPPRHADARPGEIRPFQIKIHEPLTRSCGTIRRIVANGSEFACA